MAGAKLPKVKTPAQMKAEMAVGRARSVNPAPSIDQTGEFRPTQAGDTVGGYMVREDIPDTSSIGASLENYRTLGLREVPMTAFSVRGKPEYYSKSTREYTQNLAEQINQNKELNPLIVVKDKEGYYVLEGGHRFDALRELNAQSFPALVVEDLDGMAKGGTVRMAKGGRLPKVAPKVEIPQAAPVRPLSSRIDMSFKDVTKRTPELQEAAKKIASGELSAAEYDALVNEYKPVTPYNFVPTPATREEALNALTANKKPKYGAAEEWEAGTPVGLRLDIPAYSDHGVWVNSIHGPESTAYGNVSSVRDATFGRFDDKALRVAQGESKSPFAKIEGKWNPIEEQEAVKRASEYLSNPEWRQVGMDPERHGYFYDRQTMEPIVASEEVIQIGPLVLAKNPTYGDKADFKFAHGGAVNMRDGGDPEREFIDQMKEEFSVYNKPTYGNEIPGTPSIDQQRYELTMKGRQEAENRARTTRDNLTAMDPSGTLGIVDALKTVGKSIVAPIAYVGGNAFDWLQTGKLDPAKMKSRGENLEKWMTPKTEEGGELLEEIGKVGPAITGSEMGFGMHPNLWVSGIGMTTPKQTAAGLRLGKERVTPFAKDVGSMASELYESGRMPGMVAPNLYAAAPDGKPAKVLAPANESGFYSPTEAAALNLQRKSGAGQAFLNDIMKGENVRADEIKTMGLDTFLKDKKNVTADEVRDYIAQNKTQLGEEVYRDKPNFINFLKNKGLSPDDAEAMFYKAENRDPVADDYLNEYTSIKKPKFSDYALPGGENYREIVLTLPQSPEHVEFSRLNKKMNDDDGLLPDDMQRWTELGSKLGEEGRRQAREGRYQSSHWNEPNPLAHLRVSDRVTDGKKTLLIDEVQSDWHQEGREKGYKLPPEATAPMDSEYRALVHKNADAVAKGLTPDPQDVQRAQILEQQLMQSDSSKIPDAPYKDDWYQLTLRRAIKEAIDGGYDRVALPTGSRVAERFDLSKQVDRIDYNKNDDGTYSMSAIKNGREVFAKEDLDEKELSGIVGKDVAKKIVGDEGKSAPKADRWEAEDGEEPQFKSLSGLDLSVGGEGMKKYYDEIYPGYLKKFGKKYGANVGKTEVELPKKYTNEELSELFETEGRIRESYTDFVYRMRDKGTPEPVYYMEITPAMRKEFSTGIPMKRGGKVQFAKSLDAMRHELTKAK